MCVCVFIHLFKIYLQQQFFIVTEEFGPTVWQWDKNGLALKDRYPYFEVGLKCILMVFPYLLLCSYMNENAL